jgi:hypothetical protein
MATPQVSSVVLMCDGCQVQLNNGQQFESPVEARGAGYAAGWRFPPMLNKGGGASRDCSDVCPQCAPTWTPRGKEKRPLYLLKDGTVR